MENNAIDIDMTNEKKNTQTNLKYEKDMDLENAMRCSYKKYYCFTPLHMLAKFILSL